jgi:hypothetical protein
MVQFSLALATLYAAASSLSPIHDGYHLLSKRIKSTFAPRNC